MLSKGTYAASHCSNSGERWKKHRPPPKRALCIVFKPRVQLTDSPTTAFTNPPLHWPAIVTSVGVKAGISQSVSPSVEEEEPFLRSFTEFIRAFAVTD